MREPTPTEPVKLSALTPAWLTSASPTTLPRPITRLNTPGGMPEREMISASAQAQPGTMSAGLRTTQLPKASAGATFQAGMAMGKFHGVISPTTPTGSRVTSTPTPGRTEGRTSPARRKHSPAKNLKMLPARTTSPIASDLTLPSSRASKVPSSSRRARISMPILSSASQRAWMPAVAQAGKAAWAACTAASSCAASACAYSPITSAVFDGLMFGLVRMPASHSPPM